MTDERPSTIERAYEIARSGRVASVVDLEHALVQEGYSNAKSQLQGPTLRRALTVLCKASR